ncbi:MAG: hypothetical protein ACR2RF_26225 [Geminicoccaceae bacterium]
MSDERFYVVGRVQRNTEIKLAEDVEKMGVDVCCPTKTSKGRRRRGEQGRETVKRPALPNCLVVDEEAWEDPEKRDGLSRDSRFYGFMKVGQDIAKIREAIVDEFKSRKIWDHDEVEFYSGPLWYPVFYRGDRVTIKGGPWQGLKAEVIERKAGRYRINNMELTYPVELDGLQLCLQPQS